MKTSAVLSTAPMRIVSALSRRFGAPSSEKSALRDLKRSWSFGRSAARSGVGIMSGPWRVKSSVPKRLLACDRRREACETERPSAAAVLASDRVSFRMTRRRRMRRSTRSWAGVGMVGSLKGVLLNRWSAGARRPRTACSHRPRPRGKCVRPRGAARLEDQKL